MLLEIFMSGGNIWNCVKKKSLGSFKNVSTNHIFNIYVKTGLVLNNSNGWYAIKPNQMKPYSCMISNIPI